MHEKSANDTEVAEVKIKEDDISGMIDEELSESINEW